jgi:hypothetical protein
MTWCRYEMVLDFVAEDAYQPDLGMPCPNGSGIREGCVCKEYIIYMPYMPCLHVILAACLK